MMSSLHVPSSLHLPSSCLSVEAGRPLGLESRLCAHVCPPCGKVVIDGTSGEPLVWIYRLMCGHIICYECFQYKSQCHQTIPEVSLGVFCVLCKAHSRVVHLLSPSAQLGGLGRAHSTYMAGAAQMTTIQSQAKGGSSVAPTCISQSQQTQTLSARDTYTPFTANSLLNDTTFVPQQPSSGIDPVADTPAYPQKRMAKSIGCDSASCKIRNTKTQNGQSTMSVPLVFPLSTVYQQAGVPANPTCSATPNQITYTVNVREDQKPQPKTERNTIRIQGEESIYSGMTMAAANSPRRRTIGAVNSPQDTATMAVNSPQGTTMMAVNSPQGTTTMAANSTQGTTTLPANSPQGTTMMAANSRRRTMAAAIPSSGTTMAAANPSRGTTMAAVNSSRGTTMAAANLSRGTTMAAENPPRGTTMVAAIPPRDTAMAVAISARGTTMAAANSPRGTTVAVANPSRGTIMAVANSHKGTNMAAANSPGQIRPIFAGVAIAKSSLVQGLDLRGLTLLSCGSLRVAQSVHPQKNVLVAAPAKYLNPSQQICLVPIRTGKDGTLKMDSLAPGRTACRPSSQINMLSLAPLKSMTNNVNHVSSFLSSMMGKTYDMPEDSARVKPVDQTKPRSQIRVAEFCTTDSPEQTSSEDWDSYRAALAKMKTLSNPASKLDNLGATSTKLPGQRASERSIAMSSTHSNLKRTTDKELVSKMPESSAKEKALSETRPQNLPSDQKINSKNVKSRNPNPIELGNGIAVLAGMKSSTRRKSTSGNPVAIEAYLERVADQEDVSNQKPEASGGSTNEILSMIKVEYSENTVGTEKLSYVATCKETENSQNVSVVGESTESASISTTLTAESEHGAMETMTHHEEQVSERRCKCPDTEDYDYNLYLSSPESIPADTIEDWEKFNICAGGRSSSLQVMPRSRPVSGSESLESLSQASVRDVTRLCNIPGENRSEVTHNLPESDVDLKSNLPNEENCETGDSKSQTDNSERMSEKCCNLAVADCQGEVETSTSGVTGETRDNGTNSGVVTTETVVLPKKAGRKSKKLPQTHKRRKSARLQDKSAGLGDEADKMCDTVNGYSVEQHPAEQEEVGLDLSMKVHMVVNENAVDPETCLVPSLEPGGTIEESVSLQLEPDLTEYSREGMGDVVGHQRNRSPSAMDTSCSKETEQNLVANALSSIQAANTSIEDVLRLFSRSSRNAHSPVETSGRYRSLDLSTVLEVGCRVNKTIIESLQLFQVCTDGNGTTGGGTNPCPSGSRIDLPCLLQECPLNLTVHANDDIARSPPRVLQGSSHTSTVSFSSDGAQSGSTEKGHGDCSKHSDRTVSGNVVPSGSTRAAVNMDVDADVTSSVVDETLVSANEAPTVQNSFMLGKQQTEASDDLCLLSRELATSKVFLDSIDNGTDRNRPGPVPSKDLSSATTACEKVVTSVTCSPVSVDVACTENAHTLVISRRRKIRTPAKKNDLISPVEASREPETNQDRSGRTCKVEQQYPPSFNNPVGENEKCCSGTDDKSHLKIRRRLNKEHTSTCLLGDNQQETLNLSKTSGDASKHVGMMEGKRKRKHKAMQSSTSDSTPRGPWVPWMETMDGPCGQGGSDDSGVIHSTIVKEGSDVHKEVILGSAQHAHWEHPGEVLSGQDLSSSTEGATALEKTTVTCSDERSTNLSPSEEHSARVAPLEMDRGQMTPLQSRRTCILSVGRAFLADGQRKRNDASAADVTEPNGQPTLLKSRCTYNWSVSGAVDGDDEPKGSGACLADGDEAANNMRSGAACNDEIPDLGSCDSLDVGTRPASWQHHTSGSGTTTVMLEYGEPYSNLSSSDTSGTDISHGGQAISGKRLSTSPDDHGSPTSRQRMWTNTAYRRQLNKQGSVSDKLTPVKSAETVSPESGSPKKSLYYTTDKRLTRSEKKKLLRKAKLRQLYAVAADDSDDGDEAQMWGGNRGNKGTGNVDTGLSGDGAQTWGGNIGHIGTGSIDTGVSEMGNTAQDPSSGRESETDTARRDGMDSGQKATKIRKRRRRASESTCRKELQLGVCQSMTIGSTTHVPETASDKAMPKGKQSRRGRAVDPAYTAPSQLERAAVTTTGREATLGGATKKRKRCRRASESDGFCRRLFGSASDDDATDGRGGCVRPKSGYVSDLERTPRKRSRKKKQQSGEWDVDELAWSSSDEVIPKMKHRGLSSQDKESCFGVLNTVYNYEHSEPFKYAINVNTVANYLSVVKEPMYLNKIGSRLRRGEYVSVDGFVADMKLVFYNCRQYHGSNPLEVSPRFIEAAWMVEAFFGMQLKQFFPRMDFSNI